MKRMIVPKLVTSILIIIFFLPLRALASSPLIDFEQHVISDHIPNSVTVFAIDMDMDEDIDILGSDRQNFKLYLYINDSYENFTEHVIDNIDAYHIDAADIDNDGDIDLAVVGFAIYHYEAYWYENQGNMTFVRHRLAHYGVDPSYIHVVDLDHDGDLDLVANANGWHHAHIYWYENDGSENFVQHEILDLYSPQDGGCPMSVPVDMDLDGDLDLLQACDSSSIFWLENDGNQNFIRHDISRVLTYSLAIQPIDMDHDGDVDVLASDWKDGVFWWENDGFQHFTEHRISSNRLFISTVLAKDIDHDGDKDVVEAVNGLNQVSLWLNQGEMTFTESILANDLGGVSDVSIIDLDQDGDEDIIIDEIYSGKLSWFEQKLVNHWPTVDNRGPYIVNEGGSVVLTAIGDDPEGEALTYAWDLDNNGTFETPGQSVTFSAVGLDGPSIQTIQIQVTDDGGLTATAQTTVNVLNVAPTVGAITAPINPVQVNTAINTSVNFTDPGVLDTHTAVWDWGDSSISAGILTETNGSGSVTGNHTYASAGVYTIKVTVTDDDGDSGESIFQYVVIYDPNGGFVTGGGWINSPLGAYTPDPNLTGKATFGFVSKYQKGANVPTGNTEFQFHVANLNFKSTSYDWLVIAGTKAQYKGTGTINGAGEYKFMLTAIDGTPDKFRIKIWDKATGEVIYDNQLGAEDTADPTTAIQGGSIVIHKSK